MIAAISEDPSSFKVFLSILSRTQCIKTVLIRVVKRIETVV